MNQKDAAEKTRERVLRDMPEIVPLLKDLRAHGFDVRWSAMRVRDVGPAQGIPADELLRNSRPING